MTRYTWLDAGKSASFGSDNRVARIDNVSAPATASASTQESAESQAPAAPFDPLNTPLNYAFYPFRAGFIYLGAWLNCIGGGGGCHSPKLPPVNS
jgi:hypothetical protein